MCKNVVRDNKRIMTFCLFVTVYVIETYKFFFGLTISSQLIHGFMMFGWVFVFLFGIFILFIAHEHLLHHNNSMALEFIELWSEAKIYDSM